jgi:hypothetical protein
MPYRNAKVVMNPQRYALIVTIVFAVIAVLRARRVGVAHRGDHAVGKSNDLGVACAAAILLAWSDKPPRGPIRRKGVTARTGSAGSWPPPGGRRVFPARCLCWPGLETQQPATLVDASPARQGRKGCAVRSTVSCGIPAGMSGSHPIGSSTSTTSSSTKNQPPR